MLYREVCGGSIELKFWKERGGRKCCTWRSAQRGYKLNVLGGGGGGCTGKSVQRGYKLNVLGEGGEEEVEYVQRGYKLNVLRGGWGGKVVQGSMSRGGINSMSWGGGGGRGGGQ